MEMKKNISNIHDCYGCGLCSTVCAKKIIEIRLNNDGFYEPYITNVLECSNCGLCSDVCSFLYKDLALVPTFNKSYAAWSKDIEIRKKCSSGGIGFEVGRFLINEGYKVCCVSYNIEKERAEHYIANNLEELIPSIGSKYIQSYTVDGFKAIKRKEKYLITGTPCQIDSFRRYIQRFHVNDNFILMDFFCHGVPSMFVWQKYIQKIKREISNITSVSWRNKITGWHDSWSMGIGGENNVNIQNCLSQGDYFYKLFLSDECLGKACYDHCKYKYNRSSADIRIGDLWGTTYKDNEDGVSAAVSFTEEGDRILHKCNCELISHPFDVVAEGQMKTAPKKSKLNEILMKKLRNRESSITNVIYTMDKYNRKQVLKRRLSNPLQSLKNLINSINR
jgi:coenzyme F420-reducing hydrogenase beta subunit